MRGAGGGMAGGRGAAGGRGVGAPSMTPEGMRATTQLALHRPGRLVLAFTDSTFAYRPEGAEPLLLPIEGDEIDLSSGESSWSARLKWDDRQPVLERSVEGGGEVIDRFDSLTPDRLLVTRSFTQGREEVEVRLLFDREGGG